ncbi:hypothetical protein VC940_29200, partial [Citrobacter freundii]|nr:hypothetical protein [Citrobacter freundii]
RAFARTLQKSLARSQIGGSVPHDTVTFWQLRCKEWRGFMAVERRTGGNISAVWSLAAVHAAAHDVWLCAGPDVVHQALCLLRFEQGKDRTGHGAGHLGVIVYNGFKLASPEP